MKTGKDGLGPIKRMGVVALGLAIMLAGVGKLVRGQFEYSNWWGGVVFVPFAILVGGLLVYFAVFGWERMTSAWKDDQKGRAD